MSDDRLTDLDVSSLADLVRSEVPECTAAAWVGSSVWADHSLTRDIDITAFSPDQPIHEERLISKVYKGRRLDIVVHNREVFAASCRDDTLFLLTMRELWKLADGRVLFDDLDDINNTLALALSRPVPLHLLRPLVGETGHATAGPRAWLDWYLSIDKLIFCWLHLKREHRYGKPKWFVRHVKSSGFSELTALLDRDAHQLLAKGIAGSLPRMIELAARNQRLSAGIQPREALDDARLLLAAGHDVDAVYPFRQAVLTIARMSSSADVADPIDRVLAGLVSLAHEDAELAMAASNALLLSTEFPAALWADFEAVRRLVVAALQSEAV